MNRAPGRSFPPRLEALEGRSLLTGFRTGSIILPGRPVFVALQQATSPTAPPAAATSPPPTAAPRTVSIVPDHISLGIFDKPPGVPVRASDPGFFVSGMSLIFTGRTDAGIVLRGVVPAAAHTPARIGGFVFTSAGIARGNFR